MSDWCGRETGSGRRRRGLAAPFALPAGFGGLLLTGAVAAAAHGALPATMVLVLAAVAVTVVALVAEPVAAPLAGLMGWFTIVGYSRPPCAQLRLSGALPVDAAVTMAACVLAGAGIGALVRRRAASFTLWIVKPSGESTPSVSSGRGRPGGPPDPGRPGGPLGTGLPPDAPDSARPDRGAAPGGIHGRRRVAAALLAAVGLPTLTAGLAASALPLSLDDDLLIYLVVVVAVAVVGGFWPAVLAAVAASLLLNWYFTPPVHTFTIQKPQNLLALLLFVTVAVTVSSIVHLAARRAHQAAHSGAEAASLLALAQTVLAGADTPAGVLDHLTSTAGGRAELHERSGSQWVSVAASGSAPADAAATRAEPSADLALVVTGQSRPLTPRLLHGFAAQAAAALGRERLRIQAAQAEALAEGNRMRTALLAAVSHDLRTPLSSIKAGVGTLRQPEVECARSGEASLLAVIEASADRLNALIGNLLDMTRLNTGSLQPFLRPTSVDEVAPAALRGLDAAAGMELLVPEGLPLIRTDPGLLERVLANLFANAMAYSPADRPPAMRARHTGDTVVLEIVDHGTGVPDGCKARMFEPFERLGNRGKDSGVGLGLAVAKGFTEAMGGGIAAADTPGGGLTMRVTLPVAATPVHRNMVTGR